MLVSWRLLCASNKAPRPFDGYGFFGNRCTDVTRTLIFEGRKGYDLRAFIAITMPQYSYVTVSLGMQK